jgi:aminoglycoside phosphotransferase (APT) family kinase protein
MRTVAAPEDLWREWERVLVRYAEAQLRLADHLDEIRSTGLEDASPGRLPGLLRVLLDELAAVTPEDGGLPEDDVRAFEGRLADYDRWCAELADAGLPLSVQHDDLHSSNICWGGSAESARIIDWGDASVGFPLATMLCTLNSIAWHAKTEVDHPQVCRVRDAYLEVFTGYADRGRLVRYVELARRTGCVTRALSYRAALLGEPVATHREHDFPVREWLRELLEDDALTR